MLRVLHTLWSPYMNHLYKCIWDVTSSRDLKPYFLQIFVHRSIKPISLLSLAVKYLNTFLLQNYIWFVYLWKQRGISKAVALVYCLIGNSEPLFLSSLKTSFFKKVLLINSLTTNCYKRLLLYANKYYGNNHFNVQIFTYIWISMYY